MKTKFEFIVFLFFLLLGSSCDDKYEDYCSNKDAINYHPQGKDGQCIYPTDKIMGAYRVTVIEYPLQPSEVGETYSFDIRKPYCHEFQPSYKYVQFFSLDSHFYPNDFCLFVDGYDFEFTDEMFITWAGAKVTGHGSFGTEGSFNFSGIIHRLDGTKYPIVLKGS